jgi:predicted DNA-binding transcriptional regulator AlpA
MIDDITDDELTADELDPATTEPDEPKQRKRAEHHAELLEGLANQSKQNSVDAAAAKPAVPDGKADTSEKARQGDLRLWDAATTCAFFGGIDISTLYRGMALKRYPRPVLVSAHVARWLAEECESALAAMIAARDKPKSPRRGRKHRVSAAKAKTETEDA